ncbi:MAG: hypothetical protein DMF69_03975 [Acidobacteria bacterium]|nr:MAG: hypothetical protein DMF69_03975 [Acidobacteriota bacterium]
MSEQNKSILQRWFDEVWNKGNSEAINELITDDIKIHGLTDVVGSPVTTAAEFRDYHAQLRKAFPDIVVTIDDIFAEGDKVVARCSIEASHTGELHGIAPTNAPVDFKGMAIVKVKNGKIVEAWNNFDFLKMSQQLGLI